MKTIYSLRNDLGQELYWSTSERQVQEWSDKKRLSRDDVAHAYQPWLIYTCKVSDLCVKRHRSDADYKRCEKVHVHAVTA